MPVLVFKGLNMHTLSIDTKTNLRLVPGKNEISDEHLKILQDKKKGSDGFKHLCDNGELTILGDEAVDEENELVLQNMKASDIKEVVEAEADVDVLNNYLEEESNNKNRAGVLKVIQTQIDSLKEADDSGSEE